MDREKVVILDGSMEGVEELPPILEILNDELSRGGAEVQVFSMRGINLAHCVGCFGCWLETPGECVMADRGREIVRAIVRSDRAVLFTPVTFGGYSSALKKVVDRWIPLVLPYFGKYHGETHHKPRYSRYPRLLAVGVQKRPDNEEAKIFKLLVGRNAINFHAPTFAAEVVLSTDDPETLRYRFKELLTRTDPIPLEADVTPLMPLPAPSTHETEEHGPGRALLIVGSPKVKHPSTSGVLGGYILDRLKERGWETESLKLKANLHQESGQEELLSAVKRSDLILLAFPLYIDALPHLVTKCFEIIADRGRDHQNLLMKRFFAISNNGFPEATQNALAQAICRRFAADAGMTWSGGLAMGAGEALSSGEPLTPTSSKGRPPVKHVIEALDIASAALSEGATVPPEAIPMIAKNPIPFLPYGIWRWIFVKGGTRFWQERAAENGVTNEQMLDRPYAE